MKLFKSKRSAVGLVAVGLFAFVLSGCQKEGPAEKAGKEIDKTLSQAGQQIEKAGDKIQAATGNALK